MRNATSVHFSTKHLPLILLLLSSLAFWGCKDEENIRLVTCSDGDTYALDYRLILFQDTRIWLTENDGDVAFDEPLSTSTFGVQFLNFEQACENEYTVSVASSQVGSGSNSGLIAERLYVSEYGQVPSGSALDQTIPPSLFGAVVNFQPESQIVIHDCPAIDSVHFWLNTNQEFDIPGEERYRYEYFPDENVLVITTKQMRATAQDAIVAIRTEQEEEWYGLELDILTGQVESDAPFNELIPLEVLSVPVAWPTDAFFKELEIRWFNSVANKRSTIIGWQRDETDNVSVMVPVGTTGPFIFTAGWNDGQRYEAAQVFEAWPTQVVVSSQIDAQATKYNYPDLELNTSGVDIVVLSGFYDRPEASESCQRYYTSPLAEGEQTLRFPFFAPRLRDARLDRVYEGALQENVTIGFYHYPAMNGSYSWYLRNVRSQQVSGQAWLESLEYELFSFPL